MNLFKSIADGFSLIGTSMISVFNPSILDGQVQSMQSKYDKKIDMFKVDSRGIPVDLDMPKEVIDEIYDYFHKNGVKPEVEDWWLMQDEYKATGYISIFI